MFRILVFCICHFKMYVMKLECKSIKRKFKFWKTWSQLIITINLSYVMLYNTGKSNQEEFMRRKSLVKSGPLMKHCRIWAVYWTNDFLALSCLALGVVLTIITWITTLFSFWSQEKGVLGRRYWERAGGPKLWKLLFASNPSSVQFGQVEGKEVSCKALLHDNLFSSKKSWCSVWAACLLKGQLAP